MTIQKMNYIKQPQYLFINVIFNNYNTCITGRATKSFISKKFYLLNSHSRITYKRAKQGALNDH